MTRPPTSYSFTRARSRPTFQNMMTRASKTDISEADVSPKKMKIQKKPHRYLTQSDKIVRSYGSYKGGRYALAALCRLSEAMGGGIAGGASRRNKIR